MLVFSGELVGTVPASGTLTNETSFSSFAQNRRCLGEGRTKRLHSLTDSVGAPNGAKHPSLLLAVHMAPRPSGTDTNSKQVKLPARGSDNKIPFGFTHEIVFPGHPEGLLASQVKFLLMNRSPADGNLPTPAPQNQVKQITPTPRRPLATHAPLVCDVGSRGAQATAPRVKETYRCVLC